MKGQAVRVADVVFIGPVMIVGGVVASRAGRRGLGAVLAGLGLATIAYNAHNWAEARELELRQRRANGATT